ncbi:methyltransferase [Micromonospora sp. NPDC005299]|uniref:methyltransferase n=1 Tax=Micromonospora sp. NPDC005299 TaxID=3364231 RepID=UPI003690871E
MENPPQQFARPVSVTVLEKLLGRLTSVCIQVATAGLDLPDRLRDGPKSIDELAAEVGGDRDVLLLFMRALTSESIFQEVEPGVFAHTEESRCLISDAPNSLHGIAEMLGAEWAWKVWEPAEVLHTIRTGQPAFEHVFGRDIWDYMTANRDQYAVFSRAQTIFSGPKDDAIVDAYEFEGVKTIVDLGGGEGTFLEKILLKHPGIEGVLFDLPPVVERARARVAGGAVADRYTCVGGSFFDRVPPGADAYVLKQVLHDWSDDESVEILRKVREVLPPSGRILVAAHLVPAPPRRPLKYLMAGMWVRLNTPGGYERTEQEFRDVFDRAGLELVRILPTASTHSILETRRAED